MADSKNKSGLATAGMVLGIIAIVGAWIPFLNVVSIILGILALIFSVIALVQKKSLGKAIAGAILGALSVIIAIAMIAAASKAIGDGVKSVSSSSSQSQTSEAKTENTDAKTEFNIGETASFDDKSITVTNIQRNYDTGNQFSQPESGKEFVIVTVDIANNSRTTLDYNTFEFKMQDSNGVQQSESFSALSEGKLNSGSLAKGGKVTGKLAYEVPSGDAGLKLLYQSFSFFDNKTITFNLQ